jgi:hypothetical protein
MSGRRHNRDFGGDMAEAGLLGRLMGSGSAPSAPDNAGMGTGQLKVAADALVSRPYKLYVAEQAANSLPAVTYEQWKMGGR